MSEIDAEIIQTNPDASGASFGVMYRGDTVRIVPSPMMARVCEYKPSSLNSLVESRKNDLQLLESIGKKVDGLLVPRILEWSPGDEKHLSNLVVERASGIELGANPQLIDLDEKVKIQALTIYLNAIQRINSLGRVVGDKNSSGLFIVPESEECKLWMVDPGLISASPEDISAMGGIDKIELEGRPPIADLLVSFFTPDYATYPNLVPAKIQNIVKDLKNHQITSLPMLLNRVSMQSTRDSQ